jgi:steroid delta-isomerase-like uncharacterized protein
MSTDLIRRYYDAFNAGDRVAMLGCVAEGVEHRVNQGGTRRGRGEFAAFNAKMQRCYKERVRDLVVFEGDAPGRLAAEFVVQGTYQEDDPALGEGMTPARGQSYELPAGAFFEVEDGRIARLSTFYDLTDWKRQIA